MNKVMLIGNLTKDVELRATTSGTSVASFTIAVNRRRANAAGEKLTDYFTIIAWRQLGELCDKYLSRGKKVCIVGELQTRSYEAKDGTKRYVTEVIASDVEFLTPKSSGGYQPEEQERGGFDGDMSGFTEVDDEDLPF